MQNYLWKIFQILILSILVFFHCKRNTKPDPNEIIRVGKLYPQILCEKIIVCIKEELKTLPESAQKEAIFNLPNQQKCIEDQMEAKVLPIDLNDPMIKEITIERLEEIKSCISGMEKASCDQVENPQSIIECSELYNIGD